MRGTHTLSVWRPEDRGWGKSQVFRTAPGTQHGLKQQRLLFTFKWLPPTLGADKQPRRSPQNQDFRSLASRVWPPESGLHTCKGEAGHKSPWWAVRLSSHRSSPLHNVSPTRNACQKLQHWACGEHVLYPVDFLCGATGDHNPPPPTLFFCLHHMAYGILTPWPEIKPRSSAVKV